MDQFSLIPVASLTGHDDRVWSLAWSPQGDMLASCSGDKTVRIWTRRPQASGPSAAAAAAAVPGQGLAAGTDSALGGVASASGPGAAAAAAAAAHAGQWYCSSILDQCHTRTIRSVCFSPSGRSLATASFDATVAIWELSGGVWEHVAELEGHENEVKCVAWNPDGRHIATCGRDRSVWIWESMPGREFECVDVKQGHSQDVKVVRWHPGGELLVSAGYDDTVRLWTNDGDEWTCSQTLGGSGQQGHESTVWDACWDPSGQRLATCSDDLTVRVWESRAAAAGCTASSAGAAAAAAGEGGDAGPDGAGGAGARFVPTRPDLKCSTTLTGYHARTVYSLDWSAAGLLATGDGEDSIQVFGQGDPELACASLQRQSELQQGQQAEAGWSGKGAGGGTDGGGSGPSTAGVQGAQVEACSSQGPWSLWAKCSSAHAADVNCVRWSPRQPRLLASCGDDGLIKLWWLATRGS